jgi:sirohydrochlorin cobaltochelatase
MAHHNDLGLLVVGHGTRDARGQAEFVATVEQLKVRTRRPVEMSYLELAEPAIPAGVDRLAERGVQRILVVPLLLFTAGHAKRDIPTAVAAAAKTRGLTIAGQTEALELEPHLLQLSQQRFAQAPAPPVADCDTQLLMVGRGTGDPLAVAGMRRYTQEVARRLGVEAHTAFVAVAQPSVPQLLTALAVRRPSRVVIQPHLLFAGEVLGTIHQYVAEIAEQEPAVAWCVAPHLGPDPLLVDAIAGRIAQASER